MRRVLTIVTWFALTAAAPAAGAILIGRWDERLFAFPPRPLPIAHAPLSWPVFFGLAAAVAASLLPFFSRVYDMKSSPQRPRRSHPAPAPKALCWLLLIGAWIAAWSRFEPLASVQLHTFTPLWLAYIALMNVMVFERTGDCPAIRHPLSYALLFPGSAVMWWLFEWLNRFVENWRYENVAAFSATEYGVLATAAFATVLPAMLVTKEFIGAFNPFERAFKHWVCVSLSEYVRAVLTAAGIVTLIAVPLFPNELFPLLWISPLLILLGLCAQEMEPATLRHLRVGDWRVFTQWSLAGLWCGILWELWNYRSLARWSYEIPYVAAIKIFEMPVLGYAGYLPFGVLCGLLCELCTESFRAEKAKAETPGSDASERDLDILS